MKYFLLFALFVFCVNNSNAQYYYNEYLNEGLAPGELNQDNTLPLTYANAPSGWTIIPGTSAESLPFWSDTINLPFTFEFNENNYNKIKVSNSGVVTFTMDPGPAPNFGNIPIPDESIPDNSICILGLTPNFTFRNGDIGENSRMAYKTFGTSPNRQFWITFNSFGTTSFGDNGLVVFSIVLDEAKSNIYIVDQRTYKFNKTGDMLLSPGIQIDENTGISVDGAPNVTPHSTQSTDNSSNTYYEFIQGERPKWDITLHSFDPPKYVSIEKGAITFSGIVRNLGSENVSSMTATYIVNGGDSVSETININHLSTEQMTEFTHPIAWEPDARGEYVLELFLSRPNDNTNANTVNKSLSATIVVEESLPQRRALIETFTSSSGPPSRPAAEALDSAFSTIRDKYVSINYQMNWPGSGDPYYTDEAGERRVETGVNFVTGVMIDGGDFFNPLYYSIDQLRDTIVNASNEAAIVSFEGKAEVVGQTINYDLDLIPATSIPAGAKLYMSIVEHTTYNNATTNGQTEFQTVMKKMLPDMNGTLLPAMERGEIQNFSGEYEFKGSYRLPSDAHDRINHSIEHSVEDFFNLKLVVFVQDSTTREVYNAFTTDILDTTSYYELTLVSNPADGGMVSGGGNYKYGTEVEVSAQANTGFEFVSWTDENNEVISDSADFIYKMADHDVTLTANFSELFELILEESPAGSGTVSGGGIYTEGEIAEINAEAGQGFIFQYWKNTDDEIISDTSAFAYQMPTENTVLTAHFDIESAISDLSREFTVYPNPVTDKLFIETDDKYQYSIITITGKTIKFGTLQPGNNLIDMSEAAKGFYMINLYNDAAFTTLKVVKE